MTDGSWFTLRFTGDAVELLDQTRLPAEEHYLRLDEVEDVARAIERLAVRGAPAIGCAAAMGVALGAVRSRATDTAGLVAELREQVIPRLAATRPTAVNLFWALERMSEVAEALAAAPDATPASVRDGLAGEAERLHAADVETCRRIGRSGVAVVPRGARILTHCNAGALATAGYGTALGVVRAAAEAGLGVRVLADETRPLLQGARLTAWELQRDAIPVRVCADGTAAYMMQRGEVDLVIVGADRIAANGDVANKIGTYGLAVLAKAHGIPFYVAAPLSTIDRRVATGADIPIEVRGRDELARIGAATLLPDGVDVEQPAFDVTPARLITALVTECGLVERPSAEGIRALFAD